MSNAIIYPRDGWNRFGGGENLRNAAGCGAAIWGCLVAGLARSGFISPLTNAVDIWRCSCVLLVVLLFTLSLLVYRDLVLTEGGRGSLDHNQGWKVIPFGHWKYFHNGIVTTARQTAPKKERAARLRHGFYLRQLLEGAQPGGDPRIPSYP